MRTIIKNPIPPLYLTFVLTTPGANFNGIPKAERDAMVASLLHEQGGVCGYCQQKINAQNLKVEHHCDRSVCNGNNGTRDRRLDYTNFLAVCKGNEGMEEMHCDSRKAQFNSTNGLPINVSPWIESHMNRIQYSSTGLIKSIDSGHDKEINVILNLNTPLLKNRRQEKWVKIFRLSRHTNNAKSKDKMKRILQSDLNGSPNNFTNNFPGMSEYMLKQFCK